MQGISLANLFTPAAVDYLRLLLSIFESSICFELASKQLQDMCHYNVVDFNVMRHKSKLTFMPFLTLSSF